MTDPRFSPQRLAMTVIRLCLLAIFTMTPDRATLAQSLPEDQQAVVEIVRLQHRDPESVRAAIAPVLDERGAISQIDNNLILSTSRANLRELLSLVSTLDVPRRQLRLSVDFDYNGPVIQSIGDSSTLSTVQTTSAIDNPRQSIVLTEGEHAYFSRSSSNARISPVFGPHGLMLQQDSERNGQSLNLTAEVRGEGVVLEIAATRETVAPGGSRRSEVVNTALEIGFNGWYVILDDAPPALADNLQQTTTTQRDSIAIRVELLP